jgi:hypothetical protein
MNILRVENVSRFTGGAEREEDGLLILSRPA